MAIELSKPAPSSTQCHVTTNMTGLELQDADFETCEHTISFISQNVVNIAWDNDYIMGKYISSPNGNFYLLCDKDSKDHTHLFIFNKTDILYTSKLGSSFSILNSEDCYIYNDGSCLVTDMEAVAFYNSNEKRLHKIRVENETQGFYQEVFWRIGTSESGIGYIVVINPKTRQIVRTKICHSYDYIDKKDNYLLIIGETDFDTLMHLIDLSNPKNIITKIIPPIKNTNPIAQLLYWDLLTAIFDGNRMLILYEDGKTAIGFDVHGNEVTPSKEELSMLHEKYTGNLRKRLQELLEKAENQYAYWKKRYCELVQYKEKIEKINHANNQISLYAKRIHELKGICI